MPRLSGRRHTAGFTLLELMVVLVLVGIVTGLAVLSARGETEAEALEREARRIASLMELSLQEAALSAEIRGVRFRADGYEFMALAPEGRWYAPGDSRLLRAHTLPDPFILALAVEGTVVDLEPSQPADAPQVLLMPDGETSEFQLTLATEDHAVAYTVSGGLDGRLALGRRERP